MARHHTFTFTTGVPVYFADPHSPWQRGSNENTNGRLRPYLPKGPDLSVHSQAIVDDAAMQVNGRPDNDLLRTPAEALAEILPADA